MLTNDVVPAAAVSTILTIFGQNWLMPDLQKPPMAYSSMVVVVLMIVVVVVVVVVAGCCRFRCHKNCAFKAHPRLPRGDGSP